MSTRSSSIRIEYKPLSTSESVTTLSGNLRQTYDVNTGYYQPDRRLDPLTLIVTCAVSDSHNFVNGVINNDLTDIIWKITSSSGKLTQIQLTDKQFKIGTGVDKGKITIYKNIPDLEETTLEFTAKYIESTTKRIANFQKTFSIITVTEAVAQNELQLTTPIGTVQFPFVNNKGLVIQADLIRQGEKVPAAYWWKKDGKDLTETSDKLVVLDTVKNGNVYQVEVADCTLKFNELVSKKVEVDLDVISWRNLFEKQNINLFKLNPIYTYVGGKITQSNYYSVKGNVVSTNSQPLKSAVIGNMFLAEEEDSFTVSVISEVPINIYYIVYDVNESAISNQRILGVNTIQNNKYYFYIKNLPERSHKVHIGIGNTELNTYSVKEIKIEKDISDNSIWSPSKFDLEELLRQKTEYYTSQTTLPPEYRPTPKPTNILKKEVFLKRSLGNYNVEILYPKVVDPEVTEVQFEAVFTNNKGMIENANKWFDVGWWKKTDGNYEYKGLKIKVPIAKLQTIIASGKGVEYTVIEK